MAQFHVKHWFLKPWNTLYILLFSLATIPRSWESSLYNLFSSFPIAKPLVKLIYCIFKEIPRTSAPPFLLLWPLTTHKADIEYSQSNSENHLKTEIKPCQPLFTNIWITHLCSDWRSNAYRLQTYSNRTLLLLSHPFCLSYVLSPLMTQACQLPCLSYSRPVLLGHGNFSTSSLCPDYSGFRSLHGHLLQFWRGALA